MFLLLKLNYFLLAIYEEEVYSSTIAPTETLESKGVQKLDVNPGDQFDPSIHEAVSHEDHPDFSDGQVVEVLQNGYKLKDRIIRPALVRVAK